MLFSSPVPFQEALDARAVKTLLPTEFRTKELATLETPLRERSMFSAGITSADYLQQAVDGIDSLVAGTSDRATQRTALRQLADTLGLTTGEGDLTDPGSARRTNLILDMGLEQAQGYGYWKQGQQADVLDQWPAQELIRIADAKEPRDWAAIWAAHGGTFYGGRMIALKNDPIWLAISDFNSPYPPFKFGSHMDVQDVDRDTAVAAGLMKADDPAPAPQSRGFNDDLQATPDVRAGWLRSALSDALQGVAKLDAAGVLRFDAKEAA